MAVKSREIVIVFGKGGKKCELKLKPGKKDDEVREVKLVDPPKAYDGIEIITAGPGRGKKVIDPRSHNAWDEAEEAIKLLEVTDQPDSGNSGRAVCFETRRGWFCIE